RLESGEPNSNVVPATVPKADYDELRQQRDALKRDLADQKSKYEQLTLILDWIAKTAGMAKPIRSLDEAKEAINTIQSEAKRGRPACNAADNILVGVVADKGQITATVRSDVRLPGDKKIAAGKQFRGPSEIGPFLAQVDSFYEVQRRDSNNNC